MKTNGGCVGNRTMGERAERWAKPSKKHCCAVATGVGLLFFLAAGFVHQPPAQCPTPLSRLDLLHALAHGRLWIDAYHENTPDKAEYQGHFYSDKAPGTVLLALPAFAAGALALKVFGVDLDSDRGWLISSWIACVGSLGIITALGATLMFAWLSSYVSHKAALITTLGIFLGAAPLPYATMMFSHAETVAFIAIALYSIQRSSPIQGAKFEVQGSRFSVPGGQFELPGSPLPSSPSAVVPRSAVPWVRAHRWDCLAGFCCGWALASEYTAGMVVAGIFLLLLSEQWGRAIPFCLAALLPLLLVPLYSWGCFRNPFVLPYSMNSSFPEMRLGLYAIQWPDAGTAYNLLFSPARGFLFWSPFLAISVVGYWKVARTSSRLFLLTYVIPVLQIVVISGRTWDWPAGPTLGPRYLAPILPLLALPCALGAQRFTRTAALLAWYSAVITTLATLANASPPFTYANPLIELHLPLIAAGHLSPNLGTALGLSPRISAATFYAGLAVGTAWLWRKVSRTEFPPEIPREANVNHVKADNSP